METEAPPTIAGVLSDDSVPPDSQFLSPINGHYGMLENDNQRKVTPEVSSTHDSSVVTPTPRVGRGVQCHKHTYRTPSPRLGHTEILRGIEAATQSEAEYVTTNKLSFVSPFTVASVRTNGE